MAENINYIHSNFWHSEYTVAKLIGVFQLCSNRIAVLHHHSSEDFKALSVATRNHHKQISVLHQTISEVMARTNLNHCLLPKEAKDSLAYISNIITVLQFDDIIRQKLEHIQQTILEIILELNTVQHKSHNEAAQPIKYLSILFEITHLHAAQLKQTNQDYQKAFVGIKTNLKAIQQSCTVIIKHINTLITQHEVTDLKTKLTHINAMADQLVSQISCSLAEIKYCETFAYEVGEIDKHMQKIFSGWMAGVRNDTQNEILMQLKSLYTMESERVIHYKVFETNNIQSKEVTDSPDDNLELF